MFKLIRTCIISASHALDNVGCPESLKCLKTHGHNWKVEVELESATLNRSGMVLDFGLVKGAIMKYDHTHLNDLMSASPTAENLARQIFSDIEILLSTFKPSTILINYVAIWETENCKVIYYRDNV